jgi:hypothetical protein
MIQQAEETKRASGPSRGPTELKAPPTNRRLPVLVKSAPQWAPMSVLAVVTWGLPWSHSHPVAEGLPLAVVEVVNISRRIDAFMYS